MKRVPYNHAQFVGLLQGYVRRHFTRSERRAFPDVRIILATHVDPADEHDPKLTFDHTWGNVVISSGRPATKGMSR